MNHRYSKLTLFKFGLGFYILLRLIFFVRQKRKLIGFRSNPIWTIVTSGFTFKDFK